MVASRCLSQPVPLLGALDGWAWNEVKALPFLGLRDLFILWKIMGKWSQGLFDAYIARVQKAEGAALPSALPVVYRLWAAITLGEIGAVSGVFESVFSAGKSLDAWYDTCRHLTDTWVSCRRETDALHVFVSDAIESFGTVDEGGDPSLSFGVTFVVAWYLTWCGYLSNSGVVTPTLKRTANLKCVGGSSASLLQVAQFTSGHCGRSVPLQSLTLLQLVLFR